MILCAMCVFLYNIWSLVSGWQVKSHWMWVLPPSDSLNAGTLTFFCNRTRPSSCSISSPQAVVWGLLYYRTESVTLVGFLMNMWTENSSVASVLLPKTSTSVVMCACVYEVKMLIIPVQMSCLPSFLLPVI